SFVVSDEFRALLSNRQPDSIADDAVRRREIVSTSKHYGALRGVIPPVLTPLTSEGDVDKASLARLAGFMIEAGVSGLFAGGSSAEIALLDDAQRRDVIETIVGTSAGQVPVLGGVI